MIWPDQSEPAEIDRELRNGRELNPVAGRLPQRRSASDDPARRSDRPGEVVPQVDGGSDAVSVNPEEHGKNRLDRGRERMPSI